MTFTPSTCDKFVFLLTMSNDFIRSFVNTTRLTVHLNESPVWGKHPDPGLNELYDGLNELLFDNSQISLSELYFRETFKDILIVLIIKIKKNKKIKSSQINIFKIFKYWKSGYLKSIWKI